MSIAPLTCCDVESVCARTRPFPAGQATTYMVWWRCPKCGRLSGDMGSIASPDDEARRALGAPPADPVAAAKDAFERGLVRRALAILDVAIQVDPKAAAFPAEQGRELFHAGFPDASVTALERAIALGDTTPATKGYLGLSLADTKRRGEAVALLTDAVRGDPGNGKWWHGWVRVLVRLERYDEAEAELAKCSVILLDDFWRAGLLTEKANVFCSRRKPADALAAVDEAIRIAPGSTYAHYVRGRALGMLGRIDDALAEMNRILEMAPGDADATNAKAAYARALSRR